MNRSSRLAAAGLLLLVALFPACSTTDSGFSQEAVVEAQVQLVMEVVIATIAELDPFAPTPATAEAGCVEIRDNAELCTDGGNVQDCGAGLFTFNNCAAGSDLGSYVVAGSLSFEKGEDWPSGTRSLTLIDGTAMSSYLLFFNGTDQAVVSASGDVGPAQCTVELDFVIASCSLL